MDELQQYVAPFLNPSGGEGNMGGGSGWTDFDLGVLTENKNVLVKQHVK